MHSVSRSLLVAGLVALGGLTACGDKIEIPVAPTPTPEGVTSVSIVPQQATLSINQQQQFTATVIGGAAVTDFGVTWSSTDATVASVDANGMVKAVKAGTANIIATSKANTNFRAVAPVVVTPDQPSSVNFTGLLGSNGQAAQIDSVAGQVTAKFSVTQGTGSQRIDSVQVVMTCGTTSSVVYTQRYTSGTPGGPVEATFNTAAFNATTGAALYPNATGCQVFARGFSGGSNTPSTATPSTTINLKNRDVLRTFVTTDGRQASDTGRKLWNSGAVSVRVLPTIYSGTTIASYSVQLTATDVGAGTHAAPTGTGYSQTRTVTGATGTATFALSGTGNVNNQSFPNAGVNVTAIGATGQAITFPVDQQITVYPVENPATQAFFRLDNEVPATPATAATGLNAQNQWVGGAFAFTATGTTPTVTGFTGGATRDEGVDSESYTFYAIPQASFTGLATGGAAGEANGAACAATGTTVTTGSNLSNTANTSPNGYVLRTAVTDALGNVRCVDIEGGASFGVDRIIPQATFGASTAGDSVAANGAVKFATNVINVTAVDTLSGFLSASQVLMTTMVRNDSISTATCINPNTGASTLNTAGTACSAVFTPAAIPLAQTLANVGYYTITTYAQDIANNTSTPVLTRTVIQDPTLPTLAAITQSATVAALQPAVFTGSASDNFDLNAAQGSLNYATTTPAVFGATGNQIGTFGLPSTLTGTAQITTSPVFRTLQEYLSAGGISGAAATPTVSATVTDQAGNVSTPAATAAVTLSATTVATPTINSFRLLNSSNATPTTLSRATPATWTVRVVTPAGNTDQPFTSVQLYRVSGGVLVPFGAAQTLASITIDPVTGERIYTYTVTGLTHPATSNGVNMDVRAVGVYSNGNAVISATAPVASAS